MKRVLFSLAAALALAVPSFAQVAQIGDKTYDSLAEFFVAFQSIPTGVPTTITLLADVEVDTQIVIPGGKDITLDLNGHTYTFNPMGGNNFYAFFLQQVNISDPAVSLTIEDTSAEQTGTIKASGKANACISATDAALTIHGGRFVQEGTFEYALFVSEGLVIDPAEGQTVEFPSGGVHIRRASISPYKEEGATITGGDFTGDVYYALYVGETSGGTTVNISGGTFTAGESGSSVCFDVPANANISGGDFSSGSLFITTDGEGTNLTVTGGTFKDPLSFADCGNGCLPARDENGNYTVSTGNVAAIQQSDGSYVGYPNVAAAIAAAENGVTVTLIDKGTLTEACTIASGKAITLDLNGQDIDLTTDAAQFTIPANATLEVVGKGTLRNTTVNYSRGNRIFEVRGASTDDGTKAILKVGPDVTLECTCGIVVFGPADAPSVAYGVEVEMAGTINNKMYAITTNGQITTTEGNVPVIKVTGKINGPKAVGIYAAGYAKWDLAATIDADDALSIKSGDFTIAGGSYTSSAVYAVPPSANPGGNETTGAAISITTSDGYAQKTSVNITGGDFISKNGYALYEGIAKKADGTPAANASAVTIAISGNALFQGGDAVNTDIAITEAANKKVLSGGLFTKPVDLALCADGFFPAYVGYKSYGVQKKAAPDFPVVVSTEAGAFGCESLAQAFTASSSLGKVTFTLQQNITDQVKQTLRNRNFDLTLDLNGHTLTFTDGAYFDVTTGNLTVTGSGTLSGSTVAPIWVKGGSSSSAVNYTNVTVMGDVKVTGPNAVKLYATSFGRSSGANVTLKGNAVCETTGAGILVDSSITASDGTLSTVTLSENAKIVSDGVAIQGDGYATCSITGGTIQSQGAPASATNTAFSISGGTFNKMPDDALLTPGFVFVPQEDGTFGVIEGSYIASIGDVKYADFNSFFAAFKAIEGSEKPTTVTLLADLTGDRAVPGVVPVLAGQNIVFDLNGHTMETALQQGSSTKHYYAIENSGTLTIKDSSAAQTGTIRARGVSNFAQGNLTVESGTLVAIDSDGGAALWNEGDAIVSGGKLLVEDLVGNLPAIRNEVKATLVVKGGEVQGQSRPAVINVGTMTIEGGLLWNTQCNVTSDGKHKSPWYYAVLVGGNANASLKMIGGTIRGTQGALTFIAGKGELTGGRCETVPCIYHGDTGGNIWHALYLSTTEGPVDVTVGGDFVAQSDGREAFVIGGNNEDTQKYTCKATVTGGTFIGDEESGFAALRVNNQRKDGVEPIIQGGHFEGGIVSVADTGFEPITNFVSGGTFSQAVELGYCAEGFIPVAGTEGKYTVDGTAVAAVANTEAPGAYLGYDTLAALVGEAANGTEVLIVKSEALGEEVKLLKTATGGDNAASGAAAYDVAETLGGTFKVQDGAIVYAYQLGIADLDVSESGISVTVRLEEDGTAVTRTLEGRKVRVVSDKTVLAEADAIFTDGACVLTVPAANLPAGNLELTISVAPAAEAETLAE